MKEIIINIPDESSELVMELVERLGGNIGKRERGKPVRNEKEKSSSFKKKKGDALALFGKYPDFPLDPKTYRKDLWQRNQKL